jgi:hypothetical protein
MRDANKLLDDIRRESDRLRQLYEESKRYIDKSEPKEALHNLNLGKDTLKQLEQRWEELRIMMERTPS